MTVDETPEALRRKIAEIDQALALPLPPGVRADLEAQRAGLVERLAGQAQPELSEISQPVTVTGGYVGQIIGKAIFGRDPAEDEARRLGWYLAALAGKLRGLLLRGLDEQLAQGDGIALPHVYITMATTGQVRLAAEGEPAFAACFVDGKADGRLKPEYNTDHALPDQAVVRDVAGLPVDHAAGGPPARTLYRAQLATEAIAARRRLVLLGAPGAGKSTVLRYLAWALAQRGEGEGTAAPALLGWPPERPALPILLPLRDLAGQFFANVMLHPLDLFIKQELRCRAYLRYCDDLLLFADDQAQLHTWRAAIVARLADLRLTIHEPRAQVAPTAAGFPFVGWTITPARRRLRRRNVLRFRRRYRARLAAYAAGDLPFDRLDATVKGWVGHTRHGSTTGLRRAILRTLVPKRGTGGQGDKGAGGRGDKGARG